MRAECLNCAMKYAIADEKLIRTFKIRCKNCAHEIAVHASTGGDEPAEPAPVRWHLLMDDGSVGPMGEVEVRQRFAPAGWPGPPSRHARRAARPHLGRPCFVTDDVELIAGWFPSLTTGRQAG